MNSQMMATGRPTASSRFAAGIPVPRLSRSRCGVRSVATMKSSLEFIQGTEEICVPDVRLTRSKDGTNGTAFFRFAKPSVFEASSEMGDITGLYMVDDEGTLSTVNVTAEFVNGKPETIEARYAMKSTFEWDRFMRFMERYAEEHDLGFTKSGQ